MKDTASVNYFRDITREFLTGEVRTEHDGSQQATLLTESWAERADSSSDQIPDSPLPGGGLGRGLVLAHENLKNALETLYQEVVDGTTDEYDPTGEGVMIDETMKIAKARAASQVMKIISEFFKER